MKKILLYLDSMNSSGGIERVNANLFNELSNYYDVTFLVKDSGESFYKLSNKIKVDSLNIKILNNMSYKRITRMLIVFRNMLLSIIKIRKYLKKNNVDFIFTVTPIGAFEVYNANRKNKIIATEHGSAFAYNKIYKYVKRKVYPKCYKVISPTKTDEYVYLSEGFDAKYIPHLTTFDIIPSTNIMEKENIVLNVGRLTKDKQQDILIDIWKIVSPIVGASWKLIIVGEGEEYENLTKKINNLKLSESIKIMSAQKDIGKIYSKSKIFVFTSKMEGYGMVLLESIFFGLPCISFDCPSGPKDIIEDGVNGYLIDCYDIKKFAKVLTQIIMEPKLYKSLVKGTREVINDRLKNEDIIKMWKNLIE